MSLHAWAWVLGSAGGTLLFCAVIVYDLRDDAGLAGLVALLGLLLSSQGWRLGRLDRKLRATRKPDDAT